MNHLREINLKIKNMFQNIFGSYQFPSKEDFCEGLHQVQNQTPYWSEKAQDLEYAGDLLAVDSKAEEQAIMLYCMALECLYKGRICFLEPPNGKHYSKQKIMGKHELKDLSERARIPNTTENKKRLSALTRYITWHGRYPLPRDSSDIQKALEEKDKLTDYRAKGKNFISTVSFLKNQMKKVKDMNRKDGI